MPELIPAEILRLLSVCGDVTLVGGPPGSTGSARLRLAPYEDVLCFFAAPSSSVAEALGRSPVAEVNARDAGGAWQIRIKGRAAPGPRVTSHPRKSELIPWLPEGVEPRSLEVITFWPEHIEYLREREGTGRERIAGETPGRKPPPLWLRWFQLAFGRAWPLLVVGLFLNYAWLLYLGPELTLRWLATVLGSLAVVGLQSSPLLWYRAAAHERWRRGAMGPEAAGLIAEGLLGETEVRRGAAVASAVGVAALLFLLVWGNQLAAVAVISSLILGLWPLVAIRISLAEASGEEKSEWMSS